MTQHIHCWHDPPRRDWAKSRCCHCGEPSIIHMAPPAAEQHGKHDPAQPRTPRQP